MTQRNVFANILSRSRLPAMVFLGLTACAAPPKDSTVTNHRVTAPVSSAIPSDATTAVSGTPISATIPTPSNAAPPEPAPVDEWKHNNEPERAASDDDVAGLPKNLVYENIRTTAVTVLARITAGKVWNHPEHPRDLYVNHIYQAEVLEVFRGKVADKITYSLMAERSFPLRMPTYPIVLSLCGDGLKGYYVPDNGYEFPAAPKVLLEARIAAKQKSTLAHPTTACE